MKKPKVNKKYVLYGVAVLVIAVLGYFMSGIIRVKAQQVNAEVTYVDNQLKDPKNGYYEIYAQDSVNGKQYLIEATGSSKPTKFGVKCVKLPDLKQGQRIRFSLPKAANISNEYYTVLLTCYKQYDPAASWYHFVVKK